jgi:hypothetical protein
MANKLFFYQQSTGKAAFYNAHNGRLSLLREQPNWHKGWESVVAGQFGGSGRVDLLFYDKQSRISEFYTTDARGNFSRFGARPLWPKKWDIIIPGQFAGSNQTELLFYDKESGTGWLLSDS